VWQKVPPGPLMRQIQLQQPGHFIVRQLPRPGASKGEALVRICAVGICGSDFHAFAGRHPAYTYPRVLGHELSGVVIEVPSNQKDIRVGDRCAIEPYISCGECPPCAAGRTNCCERLRVLGIHTDGGMQGVLSVPLSLLHKSNRLSLDQLALIETLGVGAHAVVRSRLARGESALVIGLGPIGLATAQFAQAAGASVRVLEKNEWRREFAKRVGFETLSEPDDELAAVVFDATGSGKSMGACIYHAAHAGRVVYVGLTREEVAIDDPLFHRRELTLYASRNSCDQFPRIIRMIESNEIDTSHWITDRLKLMDVPGGFTALAGNPKVMKAIVDVEEADA
jgi:2-desacetyl-2-hydroxyethyl bacteriochlorophyllide A dehydrogenase